MAGSLQRRGFLGGLLAAPFIVRTPGLLMAVRPTRAAHPVWFLGPDGVLRDMARCTLWVTEHRGVSTVSGPAGWSAAVTP